MMRISKCLLAAALVLGLGTEARAASPCAITINSGAVPWECDSGEDSAFFFASTLGLGTTSGSAWTSATGSNATQGLLNDGSTIAVGVPAIQVTLVQTTTITGGAVTFEANYDGTDWTSISLQNMVDPSILTLVGNPYTLQASTNKTILIRTVGARRIRVRLSTVITGSGSVTPFVTRLPYDPAPTVLQGSGTPWIMNVLQLGNTNIDVNSGNKSAGTQRVVIATDQPNLTTPWNVSLVGATPAGTNSIGTVQPGNTANTTPWLTTDSASKATGGAVPTNAIYLGANVGGNNTGLIACNSSIVYDASTNGATQLVALASSQKIYICGYSIFAAGAVNVELDYGTGTACATGNNKITPAYQLTAQTGIVDPSPFYAGLSTIPSNELCIKTSAGVAVQALVKYTQF
jgi:hypothetical protein